ncbi:MAG: YbaN family protein [Spirochaetes bacterium]|nr:YbaN family protein [Spirochaetota bacterium]MBU1081294.1 YbaN family protein [Spirochaetota bacterium]
MKKPAMAACLVFGALSLCLGLIGLAYRPAHAAPFLFIAALCFMHCCPPFISWFKRLPVYRCYIDDFIRERSMTRRNKIKTLVAGTMILAIAFFAFDRLWAKIALALLAAVKYYYVIFCVWTNVEAGHGVSECKDDDERDSA